MHSPHGFRLTALALLVAGGLGVSSAARAQTTPPPPDYNQPPPGYQQQQPPPGYQQPPPAGYQQPAPGYPPPAAYAPPPGYAPPPPPPQNVHDGFYLRLHLGGGYANMGGTNSYGSQLHFLGGGASFGVAIGGTVMPNLVIFGNLFGMGISDPDVEIDGAPYGSASGTTTIVGIGPGIAYYFDPYNVYISATVAATQFSVADSNGTESYSSDFGFGFQGMVGKEWWVTQDWGIGVAAEIIAAGGMKDKDPTVDIKWGGTAFSLVFSATYN